MGLMDKLCGRQRRAALLISMIFGQQHWLQTARVLISAAAIAVVSLVSYRLHFGVATVVLLYLLVIVLQSLAGGFISSAIIALTNG